MYMLTHQAEQILQLVGKGFGLRANGGDEVFERQLKARQILFALLRVRTFGRIELERSLSRAIRIWRVGRVDEHGILLV